jgi:hypothetical protein
MHGARHLGNEFYRTPDWYRLTSHHFIQLAAFDEFHAEVKATLALAYLVDRNDAWVLEAGSSFGFAAESFQVCFGGPRPQAKHFERDSTVQTVLMGAINHALAPATDFLQQFVIAEVCQYPCCSLGFLYNWCGQAIVAAGVDDPGYRFLVERANARF